MSDLPAGSPQTGPTLDSIKTMFRATGAENPMDFVKNNLRSGVPAPAPSQMTQVPLPPSPPQSSAIPPSPMPTPMEHPMGLGERAVDAYLSSLPADVKASVPPATAVPPAAPQATPPASSPPAPTPAPVPEATPEPEPTAGPEESLKNLRKKANELTRELATREQTLTELQTKVKRYETGEELPPVVQDKDKEIERLRYYERLYALEFSPEYQEKYVKPIEALKERAQKLAGDYGVDPRVLDEAYEIENKRDLNRFLKDHFGDEVGALEARNLLDEFHGIDAQADLARKEPQQALSRMREESALRNQEQETIRINSITTNARSSWGDALGDLSNIKELTLTGDPENDKYVQPLINEAAKEYGLLVKRLAAAGAKELPKDVATVLAKRFLLSQVSSLAIESKNQHVARAEETISSARRDAGLLRPPVGSTGGMPPMAPGPQPLMTAEAAGKRAAAMANEIALRTQGQRR